MDKIGRDGVLEELGEKFGAEMAAHYMEIFDKTQPGYDLPQIIRSVEGLKSGDFKIVFDPTLVRGMSYYTGPIFEISMDEFGSSVGGGGRYDGMVGRFTGRDVPACGFSIGFERIILILMEQHFEIPGKPGREAFLLEKDLPSDRLAEALSEARAEREAGKDVLVVRMNKNKKFQKQQLTEQGFTEFREFYARPLGQES